jgi:LuxR family transcriptional regulator, quorum-sensing system regulator SdiA
VNLRRYLQIVARCPSIEELWDAHTDKMLEYGFDRLMYGFTRYRTAQSLGDPEDFIILSNHDPAYLQGYLDEGLYHNAPMLRWALENDGACSWSQLWSDQHLPASSEGARKAIAFNRKMGVLAGYTVSFKSISARSKGAIALTAQPGMTQEEVDAVWDQHGADIELMNDVAHLKILSLPYHTERRRLTRRQTEVLEWVGDGKTVQDIAILMGLSPGTVEKHLRLARGALAVETTAQAVLKMAFANQMFKIDA